MVRLEFNPGTARWKAQLSYELWQPPYSKILLVLLEIHDVENIRVGCAAVCLLLSIDI